MFLLHCTLQGNRVPPVFLQPTLTTINVPKHYMGEAAAARLLQRIKEPGLPAVKTEISTNLVKRHSCNIIQAWQVRGWFSKVSLVPVYLCSTDQKGVSVKYIFSQTRLFFHAYSSVSFYLCGHAPADMEFRFLLHQTSALFLRAAPNMSANNVPFLPMPAHQ